MFLECFAYIQSEWYPGIKVVIYPLRDKDKTETYINFTYAVYTQDT